MTDSRCRENGSLRRFSKLWITSVPRVTKRKEWRAIGGTAESSTAMTWSGWSWMYQTW